jgi:hypothetical protein
MVADSLGVHAVAAWSVSNAGALTGVASGVEDLRLPEWLAPWVPPEIAQAMTSLLASIAPVVESLLQTAPALTGGLTVVTWVIWGLGSAAGPAGSGAASAHCDVAPPRWRWWFRSAAGQSGSHMTEMLTSRWHDVTAVRNFDLWLSACKAERTAVGNSMQLR